ncbi:MAG TPA: hypothetical protein VF244_11045 [Acidimicrobiales bacterium]
MALGTPMFIATWFLIAVGLGILLGRLLDRLNQRSPYICECGDCRRRFASMHDYAIHTCPRIGADR